MSIHKIALSLATAAAGISLSLSAAPLLAQGSTAHFQAELVTPTEESRVVAGGVLWRCEGTSCTAPRIGKRPLRVCRDLQREVGEVARFVIDGEELGEDRLTRCNR